MPTPKSNGNIETIQVTPKLASEWLALNTHNRNIRERVAVAYATDMTNGDWRWTGETIKFATDGRLIDGQHRLRAVEIADTTIPFLVVRGLEGDAQEDIDRGLPRQFHDVLQLRGETQCAALAALVKRVHHWNQGARRGIGSAGASAGYGTAAQWLRTLDAYPELRDIVQEARRVADRCELPGSLVGLCWFVFSRIDDTSDEDAEHFFNRLADGTSLTNGDAIYELRKALKNSTTNRGERSQTYLLAITIKAWNAYREGKAVQVLRFRTGGAKPEVFPEPK